MILSIGGMILFATLATLSTKQYFGNSLGPVFSKLLPATFYLVGLPLMLFGFRQADQHYRQFPNLACRHCGKPLHQSSHIVIASRNCPQCGLQIVAAP